MPGLDYRKGRDRGEREKERKKERPEEREGESSRNWGTGGPGKPTKRKDTGSEQKRSTAPPPQPFSPYLSPFFHPRTTSFPRKYLDSNGEISMEKRGIHLKREIQGTPKEPKFLKQETMGSGC